MRPSRASVCGEVEAAAEECGKRFRAVGLMPELSNKGLSSAISFADGSSLTPILAPTASLLRRFGLGHAMVTFNGV